MKEKMMYTKNKRKQKTWLFCAQKQKWAERKAFTVNEIIMVIIALGILAAIAIPQLQNIGEHGKETATLKEMSEIKKAILGDPQQGTLGYYDTMLTWPTAISQLYALGGQSPYNPFTRTGWNGPYVELKKEYENGQMTNHYAIEYDAWGSTYDISDVGGKKAVVSAGPNKTKQSGAGDDLVIYLEE